MRNLLVIGMVLVGAFMAGWFKINRDGENTTIEINRNEIRSDAARAIDRGRDFLQRQEQQYVDQGQPQTFGDRAANWAENQLDSQQEAWSRAQQQAQQAYQAEAYQSQRYNQAYPSQPVNPANGQAYPQQRY